MKKVKMFTGFKIKKREKNLDRLRDIKHGLHRNRSQYFSSNLFSTIFFGQNWWSGYLTNILELQNKSELFALILCVSFRIWKFEWNAVWDVISLVIEYH